MIEEKDIIALRESIKKRMSGKRLVHTLAVEQMAIRLGKIYAPNHIYTLRAAALLHDITKELNIEEHISICNEYGIELSENTLYAPKTLHAITAAAIIPKEYPKFSSKDIIEAVRWHTTGRKGTTLIEKLIYLADYIDDTRTFEDCVILRNYFFNFEFVTATDEERISHLRDTLIISFDMTISALIESGSPVAKETIDARNDLICDKLKANLKKG